MIKGFPQIETGQGDNSELHIYVDMTFDVPEEIAEQLELWGLSMFEKCGYDTAARRLKMSASTVLYRRGA